MHAWAMVLVCLISNPPLSTFAERVRRNDLAYAVCEAQLQYFPGATTASCRLPSGLYCISRGLFWDSHKTVELLTPSR